MSSHNKMLIYVSYINESIRPGYRKKIMNQCKAFVNLGFHVMLASRDSNGFYLRIITNDSEEVIKRQEIATDGVGIRRYSRYLVTLHGFLKFSYKYIHDIKPDAVYIRRIRPISPNIINFIKKVKDCNSLVLYEYPTFPWKEEMRVAKQYVSLAIDSILYNTLLNSVDAMVCMGNCKTAPCDIIETMNGIGQDEFQSNQIISDESMHSAYNEQELNLICVSHYSPAHGLEKILRGMRTYYGRNPKRIIILHIVGPLESFNKLISYAKKLGIDKYVLFHGYKSGDELEQLYRKANLGVDAIALELRGEECVSGSLKSREYISKGLPFICSDMLDIVKNGLSNNRFMYVMNHAEQEADFDKICTWYTSLECTSKEIQDFGRANLSWTAMMRPVAEYIESHSK